MSDDTNGYYRYFGHVSTGDLWSVPARRIHGSHDAGLEPILSQQLCNPERTRPPEFAREIKELRRP